MRREATCLVLRRLARAAPPWSQSCFIRSHLLSGPYSPAVISEARGNVFARERRVYEARVAEENESETWGVVSGGWQPE